jgi:mannosylglycerate hydrolase MGH1-like protein
MMRRLDDPAKFNGPLLPTLAFDTPHWGGYWRGPAWPRIFSYVGMALARSGHTQEGFNWLARAINSNLGPLLPENVDPNAYPPGEHAIGSVRIMGHDALDTLVFPDIAGLGTWGGEDLTVAPVVAAGYHAITRNARINNDGLVDILSACDGVFVQASYADYVGCKRTINAKEAVGGFLWASTVVERPSRVDLK